MCRPTKAGVVPIFVASLWASYKTTFIFFVFRWAACWMSPQVRGHTARLVDIV